MGFFNFIPEAFGYLLGFICDFVGSNYGVALILFSIVVKLLMTPFTAKSKKSSMKMSRLTPQMKLLQEKYANDPQKQNQEIQALYKREGVSMGGGCLWSLLPLLVLLPMFSLIREPISFMFHETAKFTITNVEGVEETITVAEGIVRALASIPELNLPENILSNPYRQIQVAQYISDNVDAINTWLQSNGGPVMKEATEGGFITQFLGMDIAQNPQWKVWEWTNIKSDLLLFLLPVASAGVQLLSMVVTTKMNNSLVTNEKGVYDAETAKDSQANKTNKTMMFVGPVMSLVFGFGFPAALSVYWLVQGVISLIIDVLLTLHYRKSYDAEDAQRIAQMVEQERAELEKERIRAERRAANPDGQTQNTSKKKLQKQQQAEQDAAKAAAAKDYAIKKGTYVEEEKEEKTTMSGIADRPYCKGRAYDPDRYNHPTEE